MYEVEKMYENAGVEPKKNCYYWYCPYSTGMPAKDIPYAERNCQDCNNPDKAVYPPFTAEKQLELYKYLCKPFLITTRYYFDEFSITAENTFEWKAMTKVSVTGKIYEECIAKLVNNLWQDLTDTDKVQIKEILE